RRADGSVLSRDRVGVATAINSDGRPCRVGRWVACYVLEGSGRRAMVVPLGMAPTMNAWTDGPMDTVAKDAWAGTSSGIAMVCAAAGGSSSRISREVLFGSGGTNEVCHQAVTVTSCGRSRDMPIERDRASKVTGAAGPVVLS